NDRLKQRSRVAQAADLRQVRADRAALAIELMTSVATDLFREEYIATTLCHWRHLERLLRDLGQVCFLFDLTSRELTEERFGSLVSRRRIPTQNVPQAIGGQRARSG